MNPYDQHPKNESLMEVNFRGRLRAGRLACFLAGVEVVGVAVGLATGELEGSIATTTLVGSAFAGGIMLDVSNNRYSPRDSIQRPARFFATEIETAPNATPSIPQQ